MFLAPAAWDTWLETEEVDKGWADDRMVTATLWTRPVPRAVSNVRPLDRHDPGLIIPVQLPCQGCHSGVTESLGTCRSAPVPGFAVGAVAVSARVAGGAA